MDHFAIEYCLLDRQFLKCSSDCNFENINILKIGIMMYLGKIASTRPESILFS